MKPNIKPNLLWLAIIVLFVAFTGCEKSLDEDFDEMSELTENPNSTANFGSGVTMMFRGTAGITNFYVDQNFLDVENEITGTTGEDYVWECCLGTGNFGDQGQLLYLTYKDGKEKPALFYADENAAGDSLLSYGVRAYWRGSDTYYTMPFDDSAPLIPIELEGTLVGELTIDIGGWGTPTLNFRIPGTTPAGYPEEYCMGLLVVFGHNESGLITTCLKDGVEQFLFDGQHKVFRLETDHGNGDTDEFIVVQGLYNGLPAIFAAEDYPDYNLSAGDVMLKGAFPGAGTELTRVLVEYQQNGVWKSRYAFPTFESNEIHNPDDGIGCPVLLREIPTLACPADCDSTVVNCDNAEVELDEIRDCAIDTTVSITPPTDLVAATEALLGSGEYKLRWAPNIGDGMWVYSRFNPAACKTGDWMFTLHREGNSGPTQNRAMVAFKDGEWGLVVAWQSLGGNVLFSPWDANGISHQITVGGSSFTWQLTNTISVNGVLELEKLENKLIPVMEGGSQIGTIKVPHEALGLIKGLGGTIYADPGNPNPDEKIVEVTEESCFYRILTDGDSFSAPDANIGNDQRLTLGIDLSLENLYFYVLNDDDSIAGRIQIRKGFSPVTVITENGEAFYPPVKAVSGIGELLP